MITFSLQLIISFSFFRIQSLMVSLMLLEFTCLCREDVHIIGGKLNWLKVRRKMVHV